MSDTALAEPALNPDNNVTGSILDGGTANDGYLNKNGSEMDWSHLNTGDKPRLDWDPNETVEAYTARIQAEQDAKDNPQPAAEDEKTATESKDAKTPDETVAALRVAPVVIVG